MTLGPAVGRGSSDFETNCIVLIPNIYNRAWQSLGLGVMSPGCWGLDETPACWNLLLFQHLPPWVPFTVFVHLLIASSPSSSPSQSPPTWREVVPEHCVNLSWGDKQMCIQDSTPVSLGEPWSLIIYMSLGKWSPAGA